MAVNSISSDIFGKMERFEPEEIILLRLALGVAEICIPWNSGFLTGLLDSTCG